MDLKRQNLVTAEEFARQLFLDELGLSIDEAARRVLRFNSRGLTKDALSRIRREVREKVEKAHATQALVAQAKLPLTFRHRSGAPPKPQPVQQKPVEPFNPPRLVVVGKPEPEPAPPAEPPKQLEQKELDMTPKAATPPPSTKEERAKYLNDWAESNPKGTIAQARDALRVKFGKSMGTAYIADTLRVARELAGSEESKPKAEEPKPRTIQEPYMTPTPVPQVPAPMTAYELAALAQTMKARGIRSITINEDGTFSYSAVVKLT